MSFFRELFGSRRERSAETAKKRLMMVLVDDRYKLTPELIEQMKVELAEVLSRYLPHVDADQIEVSLLHEDDNDRLHAQIPLKRGHQGDV